MVSQAVKELPNECCGLLAGRAMTDATGEAVGRVQARFPLLNELASPVEFTSESRSMLKAERAMREQGLDTLAVYHSHPASDPVPSRKDLERNLSGSEVVHLIISLKAGEPEVRGWHLLKSEFREAEWRID
jgi:proteasome lid subunit RPN8/RPN11